MPERHAAPARQGDHRGIVDTGEMWECPDFFPLDGKHVLLYSTERKVYWEVGKFEDQRFHSETQGLLDHGSYYAMKSMVDTKGRRILWGWVEETRTPEQCLAAGWAGSMALPRVLSIGADHRLRMQVPPEFASLQQGTEIKERAGYVSFRFKAGASACGLELRTGAQPLFAVHHDGKQNTVTVAGETLRLSPDSDGVSAVELWIDGSVIETFVDDREVMTARCYTPSPKPMQVVATGDAAARKGLRVSGMAPISSDRLTT